MKIAILAPYAPYPPHGGGTMRIYQIVRGLAAGHEVTLVSFATDHAAARSLATLEACCRVVPVIGPPPRSLARRAAALAFSLAPDMALRNCSASYRRALDEVLAREPFDVVLAESIEMAGYLAQAARRTPRPRLVLDQFNAEYVLQRRTAINSLRTALTGGRSRLRELAGGAYSLLQWARLMRYERAVLARCDLVAVVSAEDRAALARLAGHERFTVVPNGVDAAYFSRTALPVVPPAEPATLVFSGTLDYRPNVDALAWFCGEPFERIRRQFPDIRLLAVGRRPAPALTALARAGRLGLTGELADVRPALCSAAVYVVPMRVGGGMRLKVLEALSLELPVVSTSLGIEGVAELAHDVHCLVADAADTFADAVITLLHDRERAMRLARAGRTLVAERYDWSAIVPAFARQLAE
jgi:glycosyltransferase involved in cell wall biosynthesis